MDSADIQAMSVHPGPRRDTMIGLMATLPRDRFALGVMAVETREATKPGRRGWT